MAQSIRSLRLSQEEDEVDDFALSDLDTHEHSEVNPMIRYSQPSVPRDVDTEGERMTEDSRIDEGTKREKNMQLKLKEIRPRKTTPPTTVPPTTVPPPVVQRHPTVEKEKPAKKPTRSFRRRKEGVAAQSAKADKMSEEDVALKELAFSRRRNYTEALPQRGRAYRDRARRDILNTSERGICEEGLCRKFEKGRETPFDYSASCLLFRIPSLLGNYPSENRDITMVATAT